MMKLQILALPLGLALSLVPARGEPGPLAGTYEVTVKIKAYGPSEKPDAPLFDELNKSLTRTGTLTFTDSVNDFGSDLAGTGQVSDPKDPSKPPQDVTLTGIRKGKNIYLSGTVTTAGILPA